MKRAASVRVTTAQPINEAEERNAEIDTIDTDHDSPILNICSEITGGTIKTRDKCATLVSFGNVFTLMF